MDLTPPLENLRQGMDRNWRRNLKQDEERNLEVIRGSDETMLEDLAGIYKEMVSRKSFAASESIGQFTQIQAMLPDSLKLKIMLCKHDGKLCAGVAWSALGDTGIELIAATSNAGTQYGGAHLLRWKMVEELKQQGASSCNLNGINPEKNSGTYRFKKGLAGKNGREVSYMGKLDASAGPLSESLIRLRDSIKKRLSH
jgi:lipid II:glycine glycyltransferase (peptidoglycan interpeptide bridge formation enzyme)